MIFGNLEDYKQYSRKKLQVSCDTCNKIYESDVKTLNRRSNHDCYSCVRKGIYTRMDKTKLLKSVSENASKRLGHLHPNYNPNRSAFQRYRREVQTLTERNYKQFKPLINPESLPRTKMGVVGGYQLDHKISVKEGFERNLEPNLVASINNLQMLSWRENRQKASTTKTKEMCHSI